VESCFKEKFAVPRQAGLVPSATSIIKIMDEPFLKLALKELDQFSHIWLIFVFHQPGSKSWKPSIRPPRLGGAIKVGVLASRSPHRPNPIGMSAVRLARVDMEASGGPELHVLGADLMDGTPIIDIKPYIPYADSIPDANPGWAVEPIKRVPVEFNENALKIIATHENPAQLKQLILEILRLDPRPSFQKKKMPIDKETSNGMQFGFKLFAYDVKWVIKNGVFLVHDLATLDENGNSPY
jgi:tRNA-Thr(GGU) m(6)t(6)A37 methyltransferase TsaA